MIEEIEIVHISDFITKYLDVEGCDISLGFEVKGETLTFSASLQLQKETIKKQCYNLFNKKFLELLPNFEIDILKDTRTE